VSVNKLVRKFVALYRSADSTPLMVGYVITTPPNQAYADIYTVFEGGEEVFLLLPIEQVERLRDDLNDCLKNHRKRVEQVERLRDDLSDCLNNHRKGIR
jgi:hypothetical protein